MDYPMAGQMRWDTSSLIARLERNPPCPRGVSDQNVSLRIASHVNVQNTCAWDIPAGRACEIAISVLGQAARQACQQVE